MAIELLIDARKLGDGGIGVYIENLIDGFLELEEESGSRAVNISLLVKPDGVTRSEWWEKGVKLIPEPAGKYSVSEYLFLARRHRNLLNNVDLFHSPHYTLPFFLGVPAVVTIHDVIHIDYPDTFIHHWLGLALVRSALRRAAKTITVSTHSRERLAAIFPAAASRIEIITNALRRGFIEGISDRGSKEFLGNHGLPGEFSLFVGSERPHKRFFTLLEAWSKLKNGKSVPNLVAVGGRFSDEARQAVKKLALEGRVFFFGEAEPTDLLQLYKGATAVVIPSVEEGFGLVALEAMVAGAPLVCTPLPSVMEICGDIAWYSRDFEADSISQALAAMFADEPGRRAKAARGMGQGWRFSRKEVARETLALYRRVLNRPEKNSEETTDHRKRVGG